MNERVMQFRIGLFVIVSGLVLTMMVVWFGETPSLLRDQVYLKVHYPEAPGVLEGVPVRKSGIRIGEVMSIAFDERKNQPDGVIVTLALERRYPVRVGSVPKLTRSLIGDVAIDMVPGDGTEFIKTSKRPADPDTPLIEGQVAPDPSKALAAATKAFEKAGDTLESINAAANGLAKLTKSSDNLDRLLTTWNGTGQDVSGAAKNIRRFIDENDEGFRAAVQKLNETLDPETQKALKDGIARFASAANRIDSGLAELDPALKDLGAPVKHTPDDRHRPGIPPAQPGPGRPRAVDQPAAGAGGRPQHRGEPAKAARADRPPRQPQPHGRLGQPGLPPAPGRARDPSDVRRQGRLRPGLDDARRLRAELTAVASVGSVIAAAGLTSTGDPGLINAG